MIGQEYDTLLLGVTCRFTIQILSNDCQICIMLHSVTNNKGFMRTMSIIKTIKNYQKV